MNSIRSAAEEVIMTELIYSNPNSSVNISTEKDVQKERLFPLHQYLVSCITTSKHRGCVPSAQPHS